MREAGRLGPAPAGRPDAVRGLSIAAALAFLAGATDVYGLAQLRGIFVSFMSGNTTLLGMALGHHDWMRAALIAGIVGLFVAGGAAGGGRGIAGGRGEVLN